ncbi:MAG: hypothetical protein IJ180_08845 [Bacteroidales bacterium]|nr:hypothetical protein [Bacteroidales bacterium]
MIKLNQNQYQKFAGWGNTVSEKNHIYAYFGGDRQKAYNHYMRVLEFDEQLVTDVLKKFPTKVFDDDKTFEWDLITSARRNVPLLEARDEKGVVVASDSGMIGVGTRPFYLVFPTSYFAKGDTIVGNYNEKYPLRILEEPKNEGSNVVCKVELMAGITTGMPAERLLAGERFSYEYDVVASGLSRQVGDLNFTAPIKMSNEFSTYRLRHKASGDMLDMKIAMGMPVVENGKVTTENYWMHYIQFLFDQKFKEQEANLVQFARSNRTSTGEYFNHDDSGRVIRMGSGIYEQVESGNVEYYNDTNEIIPRITSALDDICNGKIPMKSRTFMVSLGSKAYKAITEYATKDGSGWKDMSVNNPAWATKAAGNDVPNGVAINNYQVNEWVTSTGTRLIFKIQDCLDDPVRNKLRHHEGGLLSSYRINIWHLGNDMSEPNIQIARPKNDMSDQPVSIQWGIRDPFTGRMSNMNMSYDEDSATIHKMGSIGAIVYDPLRCYSLIPNYSAAV